MDALIALAAPDLPDLTGTIRTMAEALWPGEMRLEAVHTANGVALAGLRTANGARVLGAPRIRNRHDIHLAQRFDWPTLESDPSDEGNAWLARLAGGNPESPPTSGSGLAGIVLEEQAGRLTVLRDPLGECPFWYAQVGSRFAVATHPAPLLALDWIPDDPDPIGANPHLAILLGAEQTSWRAIRRVPPGHRLIYRNGSLRLSRWWELTSARIDAPLSDEEWLRLSRVALERAVARRIPAQGPIGSQLSGGLDSTAVALLAARQLEVQHRPLHTFSHVPAVRWNPPQPGDETPYIEAALGCMPNAVAHFLTGVACAGEIYGRSLTSHDLEVREAARASEIPLMLSGWGGDEGMSYNGDGYLAEQLLRGRLASVVRWCWQFGRGRPRNAAVAFYAKVVMQQLGLLRPTPLHPPRKTDMMAEIATLPDNAKREVLARHRQTRRLRRAANPKTNQHRLLTNSHLAFRIEHDALWSVPAGFTFRYPLLDPDLLRLVLAVPGRLFVAGGRTRTLMRRALLGVYPDLIQERHGKFPSHPAQPIFTTT